MGVSRHVLVVGAGSIGERHVRCFLATRRARVSFVEVRTELRAEMAGRYPDAAALESLDAALGQKVDAAVIATPAPLHVPQALQLVDRGVHVLIEKPLAVTMAGVDDLAERVVRNGVIAAVAYVMRAHPALAELREAIASGRFGRPLELVAVAGQNFPFYRPAYAQTYYAKHETGGGAVQDALTHVINAGQWILGPVRRVVADLAHQSLAGTNVEDTAHVLARHDTDVPASYSLNQHQAPNETAITVVCERGTARFELHANRWRSMSTPGAEWSDHPASTLDRDALFVRQAERFLDAVDGLAPPACSLAEGILTLRANLAILESARTAAWISIEA